METEYQKETFELENEHWWYRARREIITRQIRSRFPLRKDLKILDIGCGAGTILQSLGSIGKVTGLDASADAAIAASNRLGCKVLVGSIPDNIPRGLGMYDVVGLFDVIEHLDSDVEGLRCVRHLLDDEGALFVTVPAQPWLFGIHDEINEHRRRYTRKTLQNVLRRSGFTDFRISYFNMLLSPLLVPAILWRNARRDGHHFELRSRIDPILEKVFAFEKHLVNHVRLPFGLSLIAHARKARVTRLSIPSWTKSESKQDSLVGAGT